MWAQLIKVRLKPGKDTAELGKQLQAVEQPGSGLVRTLVMRDQKDPGQVYTVVVFESEEKARAREQDPRRQEGSERGGGVDRVSETGRCCPGSTCRGGDSRHRYPAPGRGHLLTPC